VVLPIGRALRHAGGTVVAILGARTRDLNILEDETRAVSDRCIMTTDVGAMDGRDS
jgi:ferredoxin--NADP+ reductase